MVDDAAGRADDDVRPPREDDGLRHHVHPAHERGRPGTDPGAQRFKLFRNLDGELARGGQDEREEGLGGVDEALQDGEGKGARFAGASLGEADDVLAWGSGGGVEGGVVGWAASPRVASRPGARRPRRVRHGRLMMTPHRRTNAHGRRPRARRAARDGGPPPRPCDPPRASLTPSMRPILSYSYLSAVGARPPSGCRSGSPTRAQPPRPPAVCKRQAPQTQRTRCRLVRRAPS
jgi:hypothetical protein